MSAHLSELPSVIDLVKSIKGLPASAVVPVQACQDRDHKPGECHWMVSATPGANEGWYVEVAIRCGVNSRLVANIRVDGGLNEAGEALDLLRDRLKSVSPDLVRLQ